MNNALTNYMNQINFKRSLFGEAPLDPYTDFAEVYTQIDSLGSPEILSMDGELSIDEVAERTNMWIDAIYQLKEIEKEIA